MSSPSQWWRATSLPGVPAANRGHQRKRVASTQSPSQSPTQVPSQAPSASRSTRSPQGAGPVRPIRPKKTIKMATWVTKQFNMVTKTVGGCTTKQLECSHCSTKMSG